MSPLLGLVSPPKRLMPGKFWKSRCPISLFESKLLSEEIVTSLEIEKMDNEIGQVVDRAVEFGLNSPYPDPSTLKEDIYA